ncbi:MAG: biopolymer transporter ExbD, partial [Planctomycetaceae bacterium]|nr:biopolymer transporter ExbD [Planctomycetaceae bacterium]
IAFKRRQISDTEMDMTPMVDVTFQLLIFFMITMSVSLIKAMEVPKTERTEDVAQQRTVEELEEDNDYIIVRVDQESVIWVNDREAPTRQELLARLREELSGGPTAPKNLMVVAHPKAKHGRVVLCLDVGAVVGIEKPRLRYSEEDI